MQNAAVDQGTIDKLNSFLRGELSAAESYRQAIEKFGRSSKILNELEECARSHENRATLLTQEVRLLGGEPAKSSGVWGMFAKLVEGGANAIGEKAAVAALEQGEDHGRDDYRRDLDGLNVPVRHLIEARVLPEQERTHRMMSNIKKMMS